MNRWTEKKVNSPRAIMKDLLKFKKPKIYVTTIDGGKIKNDGVIFVIIIELFDFIIKTVLKKNDEKL